MAVFGNFFEREALGARGDRRRQFFVFGRREDDDGVLRRLLERFEERVQCGAGEHVRFVDNINFRTARRGRGSDAFFQVADLVDAAVRCRVDLDDVERILRVDLAAGGALVAGLAELRELGIGPALLAVQKFCEEPRRGCLSGPARAVENICLPDAPRFRGVFEDLDVGLLPKEILEFFRPIFAIERLCHNPDYREYSPTNQACLSMDGFRG